MNKELQYITGMLQQTLQGQPWYGRPAMTILKEVDPAKAYLQPGKGAHSMADLLYHIITWAEFTFCRLEGNQEKDDSYFDRIDWRPVNPTTHPWQQGIETFDKLNDQIIALLQTKDDSLLKEKVDFRDYNFRFLLHGYIQHNIYHLGQIAYTKKLLEEKW